MQDITGPEQYMLKDVPGDRLQASDTGSNGHMPVGIHNTALGTDMQDITGSEQQVLKDVPGGQTQTSDARNNGCTPVGLCVADSVRQEKNTGLWQR
ncbi:hypothetical protein BC936DRAFT_148829 [Jimgerdemannia flammicorona]|uniref:Uncharacterized protein n=1 Tax=Jimgerdemannia flammicorona TaxID=994334 RepID=A0A433D280_9FUNG|nr:hypothetical protein BC936DRAFT_148829 [Jimgerdemannia flammicorona]RUS18890.1 hypothetical protein BC937DRAFT_88208 [Endogone sp. FLAS-F59071]|eukprot:RUS18890.1 hypothetical protein BC937DRAFT_88208 [Endogone sp. FLAS-F59071]